MTALVWSKDPFKFGFSAVTDPSVTLNLKDAAFSAAQSIMFKAKALGLLLYLFSSGGIDSEIMCERFRAVGADFTVVTLDYKGMNEHDTRYAKHWCRARGVKHIVIPLDMNDFIYQGFPACISAGLMTNSVYRALQIRMLTIGRDMGGFPVIGGGENARFLSYDRSIENPGLDDLYVELESDFVAPFEWEDGKFKEASEPYFYLSTPELVKAWYDEPINAFLAHHRPQAFDHYKNRYTIKKLVYHTSWPLITDRENYDGFERFAAAMHEVKDQQLPRVEDSIETYRLPLSSILSQLSGV